MDLDELLEQLIKQSAESRKIRLMLCEKKIRKISALLYYGEFIEILDRVYHEQESEQETITGQTRSL